MTKAKAVVEAETVTADLPSPPAKKPRASRAKPETIVEDSAIDVIAAIPSPSTKKPRVSRAKPKAIVAEVIQLFHHKNGIHPKNTPEPAYRETSLRTIHQTLRYLGRGGGSARTQKPEETYAKLIADGQVSITRRKGKPPLLKWLKAA